MAAAAVAAWLGASSIVLADGRRGLALGLVLVAGGLAILTWPAGGAVPALALLAGGGAAAVRFLSSGKQDWGLMPAGSTPRLILAIAAAVIALWFAASVTSGSGAELRFAELAVLALLGARTLHSSEPDVLLASVAGLALAVGAASGLAAQPSAAPFIVAAMVAGTIALLPRDEPRGT
jgi:hypothetical protein